MNKIKFFSILALMLLVCSPVMAAGFNAEEGISKFFEEMGFMSFFMGEGWKNAVMLLIGCFLLYLAIKKVLYLLYYYKYQKECQS